MGDLVAPIQFKLNGKKEKPGHIVIPTNAYFVASVLQPQTKPVLFDLLVGGLRKVDQEFHFWDGESNWSFTVKLPEATPEVLRILTATTNSSCPAFLKPRIENGRKIQLSLADRDKIASHTRRKVNLGSHSPERGLAPLEWDSDFVSYLRARDLYSLMKLSDVLQYLSTLPDTSCCTQEIQKHETIIQTSKIKINPQKAPHYYLKKYQQTNTCLNGHYFAWRRYKETADQIFIEHSSTHKTSLREVLGPNRLTLLIHVGNFFSEEAYHLGIAIQSNLLKICQYGLQIIAIGYGNEEMKLFWRDRVGWENLVFNNLQERTITDQFWVFENGLSFSRPSKPLEPKKTLSPYSQFSSFPPHSLELIDSQLGVITRSSNKQPICLQLEEIFTKIHFMHSLNMGFWNRLALFHPWPYVSIPYMERQKIQQIINTIENCPSSLDAKTLSYVSSSRAPCFFPGSPPKYYQLFLFEKSLLVARFTEKGRYLFDSLIHFSKETTLSPEFVQHVAFTRTTKSGIKGFLKRDVKSGSSDSGVKLSRSEGYLDFGRLREPEFDRTEESSSKSSPKRPTQFDDSNLGAKRSLSLQKSRHTDRKTPSPPDLNISAPRKEKTISEAPEDSKKKHTPLVFEPTPSSGSTSRSRKEKSIEPGRTSDSRKEKSPPIEPGRTSDSRKEKSPPVESGRTSGSDSRPLPPQTAPPIGIISASDPEPATADDNQLVAKRIISIYRQSNGNLEAFNTAIAGMGIPPHLVQQIYQKMAAAEDSKETSPRGHNPQKSPPLLSKGSREMKKDNSREDISDGDSKERKGENSDSEDIPKPKAAADIRLVSIVEGNNAVISIQTLDTAFLQSLRGVLATTITLTPRTPRALPPKTIGPFKFSSEFHFSCTAPEKTSGPRTSLSLKLLEHRPLVHVPNSNGFLGYSYTHGPLAVVCELIGARVVIASARGISQYPFPFFDLPSKSSTVQDMLHYAFSLEFKTLGALKLKEIASSALVPKINELEANFISKTFKFGILTSSVVGICTEDDLYKTDEISSGFNEFLELMGKKLPIQSGYYNGSLTDAKDFYWTKFKKREVAFHVGPLIMGGRLDRKRHVGNNVSVIIYQDNPENQIIDTSSFSSQFNSIFLVVQRILVNSETKYRIYVASKHSVQNVSPFLDSTNNIFSSKQVKKAVLTKLMNTEQFGLTGIFREPRMKARWNLMVSLFETEFQAIQGEQVSAFQSVFLSSG